MNAIDQIDFLDFCLNRKRGYLVVRDHAIWLSRYNGATYSSIAREYDRSEERIRQIVWRYMKMYDHWKAKVPAPPPGSNNGGKK